MTLKKVVIHFTLFSPILSMLFLFPKRYHWFVTILGRCIIPITLGNTYLFGVSTYLSVKWGLANDKVTEERKQK